jgi:putative flippase GtrA
MSVTTLTPTTGPRPLFERLACSLGVSIVTTLVSTAILVLLAVVVGIPAGAANAIGVVCGIPLSYMGNRRWVWRRDGASAFGRELLPFWTMCLLGLLASTVVVGRVGELTAGLPASWRAVILPLANAATFAALWVVQFVLLDRVIFRTGRPRTDRPVTHPSLARDHAA